MVVLVCALFDIWVWEKYVWRIRKKGNKVPVNTYINITIRKYLSILCFKFNPAFAFGINISARLSILEFEFQTVKFQHVSSSNFAQVFWVLARVIKVFQVFALEFSWVWILRVNTCRTFDFRVAQYGTSRYPVWSNNQFHNEVIFQMISDIFEVVCSCRLAITN